MMTKIERLKNVIQPKKEQPKVQEVENKPKKTYFIELDGVDIPSLDTPKGDEYLKKMKDIRRRIEKRRAEKSRIITIVKEIDKELTSIRHELLLENDPTIIDELKNRQKDLMADKEQYKDLHDIDINYIASRLINTDEVNTLRSESLEEFAQVKAALTAYQNELDRVYNTLTRKLNSVTADLDNQLSHAQANRINLRYNQ